jgi:hypothetical protein
MSISKLVVRNHMPEDLENVAKPSQSPPNLNRPGIPRTSSCIQLMENNIGVNMRHPKTTCPATKIS